MSAVVSGTVIAQSNLKTVDRLHRHLATLSERDLIILQYLADGETVRQTSINVGMSYQLLKNRLRLVYEYLGADNAHHAVAIALRRRLIN